MQGRLMGPAVATSDRDFRLSIEVPQQRVWEPGQFVMLRWGAHLVGRPFAIVDWKKSRDRSILEVWIRRLGAATDELFATAAKDMPMWVTAPLGSGLPKDVLSPRSSLLIITGGVGAASILSLVHHRAELQKKTNPQKSNPLAGLDVWIHGEQRLSSMDTKVLAGAAALRPDMLCIEEKAGAAARKALPRSMNLYQGRVTHALEQVASESITAAVACGPTPMLEAVVGAFAAHERLKKLPLYLGLEEKMGCGIGLCFSCSVKADDGMKRCCLEGPWFEAAKIPEHFTWRKEGRR